MKKKRNNFVKICPPTVSAASGQDHFSGFKLADPERNGRDAVFDDLSSVKLACVLAWFNQNPRLVRHEKTSKKLPESSTGAFGKN
jgi:hypothetical protein